MTRFPPLLLTLLLVAAASAPAPAQTPATLEQREREYRAARSDVQAARDAWAVVEGRFSDALEEVARARRSRDDGRLEGALALAQAHALELHRADQRLREEEQALEEARRVLLAGLDGRRRRLEAQVARAASPRERRELDALIRDLAAQYRSVSEEDSGALRLELAYVPSITFDPRDGPLELEAKAELLERRAEGHDSTLAAIDREIERLEGLLRLERSRRSFRGNLDRFGDTQVPVSPPRSEGAERSPPPEAGGGDAGEGDGATLARRVESLRVFRGQVEQARDQFLLQARLFRQRLRRGA